MGRTTRWFNRRFMYKESDFQGPYSKWWSERMIRKFGSIDRAIAKVNKQQAGDHKPGYHNAPSHYRRMTNRIDRSKANNAIRYAWSNGLDWDGVPNHVFKRSANHGWF